MVAAVNGDGVSPERDFDCGESFNHPQVFVMLPA
jgi:hypothetical protein